MWSQIQSTKLLTDLIVEREGPTSLRPPSQDERHTITQSDKERGMQAFMGSLDCCLFEWLQCPTGSAATKHSRKGKKDLVVEAV